MDMILIGFERQQLKAVHLATRLDRRLGCNLNFFRQYSATVARYPDEMICGLIVAPARLSGLQCIIHSFIISA